MAPRLMFAALMLMTLTLLPSCCGVCLGLCGDDEVEYEGECTPCPDGTMARREDGPRSGRVGVVLKYRYCAETGSKKDRHGPYVQTFYGKPVYWGHYRKGRKHGKWTWLPAPNDTSPENSRRIFWYRDGERQGHSIYWSVSGAPTSYACFFDDALLWSDPLKDPRLTSLTGEQLHARWPCPGGLDDKPVKGSLVRRHHKGRRSFTGRYRKGRPHGTWTWFDLEGEVIHEAEFSKGRLVK